MFAPPVVKAQTKAPAIAIRRQAPTPSMLLARPFGGGAADQLGMHERSIGNRATLRPLAQRAKDFAGNEPDGDNEQYADPANSTARGAMSGVSWNFSRISIFPPGRANEPEAPVSPTAMPQHLPRTLQPKLRVGAVDDPLEREADGIADQVVRSLASTAATPTKFSVTPSGRAVRGRPVAAAAYEPYLAEGTSALVSEVLARPGRPLDGESREAFGSRFDCDFSAVRVHTDAAAATSTRALNASAYTVGNTIVFGEGKYNQRSREGARLLAHELAHVTQQTGLRDGGTPHRRTGNQIQSKATPSGSTAAVAPTRLIQRAPPQPPAPGPDPLILGSTNPAAETESLFHYGDLTGKETLTSLRSYPRLTNCDIATTVEDAAKYTGTPVRDTVKYKYELKIERGHFAKYFKNAGTRNGFSEFSTDQPIPVKYFRKIATLLRTPPGGAPPTSAGGGGLAGGGATGGRITNEPPIAPKPGQLPGSSAEAGAVEGALPKSIPTNVPGGVAQGAVEGAEGAAASATARAVLQGGLRFLGGVAVGAAVGLVVGRAYAYLTRKQIEADISNVLQSIPADEGKRIQARIDALPAGKKKLARVTLEYTMWRSTLGFLGGPDAYQMQSVRLVNVHPGNEELDFPSSTEERLGETIALLASQKVTVRISYTVPIDLP